MLYQQNGDSKRVTFTPTTGCCLFAHILVRAVQSRGAFIARRTRTVTTEIPLRDMLLILILFFLHC